jgi:hypothetical protein
VDAPNVWLAPPESENDFSRFTGSYPKFCVNPLPAPDPPIVICVGFPLVPSV